MITSNVPARVSTGPTCSGSPFGIAYRPTAEGFAYESSYHDRPRVAGGDVDVCFGGRIAVSRVRAV